LTCQSPDYPPCRRLSTHVLHQTSYLGCPLVEYARCHQLTPNINLLQTTVRHFIVLELPSTNLNTAYVHMLCYIQAGPVKSFTYYLWMWLYDKHLKPSHVILPQTRITWLSYQQLSPHHRQWWHHEWVKTSPALATSKHTRIPFASVRNLATHDFDSPIHTIVLRTWLPVPLRHACEFELNSRLLRAPRIAARLPHVSLLPSMQMPSLCRTPPATSRLLDNNTSDKNPRTCWLRITGNDRIMNESKLRQHLQLPNTHASLLPRLETLPHTTLTPRSTRQLCVPDFLCLVATHVSPNWTHIYCELHELLQGILTSACCPLCRCRRFAALLQPQVDSSTTTPPTRTLAYVDSQSTHCDRSRNHAPTRAKSTPHQPHSEQHFVDESPSNLQVIFCAASRSNLTIGHDTNCKCVQRLTAQPAIPTSRRPLGLRSTRANNWGPGASQWSMDDRSSVMSDWQRVLDWLLA
jgi:hypothetical protein